MPESHRFAAGHLHSIARRMFTSAGTPRHIADDVAEILVDANLTGHDSHGVLRIPAYLQRIGDGRIDPAAEPQRIKETASTLIVDGGNGFGHYAARVAMQWAIEKAQQADVCCASLRRTGHIGRLGDYAEQAARAGCIGLITAGTATRGEGLTAPFGGIKGALGTNPIAVGVPTGDGTPFILDYATSVIAEGKIKVARSTGADLPDGVIIDKDGHPSVKPAAFYDGGFLLPFGRHKGYALGLVVSLLGGLSGEYDGERGRMGGAFLQAINISAFTPLAEYQRAVRAMLNGVKAAPPAPGVHEVLAPGDPEHLSRVRRMKEEIALPDSTYQEIREWAQRLRVSLSEDTIEAADVERYRLTV